MKARPVEILDTFQKHNLAPEEWELLADQLLQRGVQKTHDEVRLRKKTRKREEKRNLSHR